MHDFTTRTSCQSTNRQTKRCQKNCGWSREFCILHIIYTSVCVDSSLQIGFRPLWTTVTLSSRSIRPDLYSSSSAFLMVCCTPPTPEKTPVNRQLYFPLFLHPYLVCRGKEFDFLSDDPVHDRQESQSLFVISKGVDIAHWTIVAQEPAAVSRPNQ